ncbi:MAG: hypothetical protein GXO75_16170 [Calditrichaeota bacterium]|nr:hypothetical protein [Calditrichota bacterium]
MKEANDFVRKYHRHNDSTQGGKFAISLWKDEKMIGVAIAGRPVARNLDDGFTVEILRVCTDGTKNANSKLYGTMRKICKLMGYKKIITYTLQEESGSSLLAVGAEIVAEVNPQEWNNNKRKRKSQSVYKQYKFRWEL